MSISLPEKGSDSILEKLFFSILFAVVDHLIIFGGGVIVV